MFSSNPIVRRFVRRLRAKRQQRIWRSRYKRRKWRQRHKQALWHSWRYFNSKHRRKFKQSQGPVFSILRGILKR